MKTNHDVCMDMCKNRFPYYYTHTQNNLGYQHLSSNSSAIHSANNIQHQYKIYSSY